jgi:hypothetical protein
MKRLIAVLVGAAALVGCGSTKYVTTTDTQTTSTTLTSTTTRTKIHVKRGPPITTTETTTHTITASSPAFEPSSHGQAFSGDGAYNIGTIHVHDDSELYWSCSSCADQNFQMSNSDPNVNITVNALGPTSGKTFLDAGDYHDVTVNTEGGAWAITINPG